MTNANLDLLRLSLYIVSRKGYSFGWPTKNPKHTHRTPKHTSIHIHIYQNSGELFAGRARLMAESVAAAVWPERIVIINDVSVPVSELGALQVSPPLSCLEGAEWRLTASSLFNVSHPEQITDIHDNNLWMDNARWYLVETEIIRIRIKSQPLNLNTMVHM